jgi:hypothetical protein
MYQQITLSALHKSLRFRLLHSNPMSLGKRYVFFIGTLLKQNKVKKYSSLQQKTLQKAS